MCVYVCLKCSVCDLRLHSAKYISHNHYPHYFLSYYPYVVDSFLYVPNVFESSNNLILFVSLNQLRSCVLSDFIIWHFLKRILSPSIPVKVSRIVNSLHFLKRMLSPSNSPVGFPYYNFFLSIHNTKLSNIPPPPDSTMNWDSHDKRIIWLSPCQSETQYHEKGKVSAKHVT